MILFENERLVAVATAYNGAPPSGNLKTGNMIQVWILPVSTVPSAAIHTGADAAVCGDCPLRPANNGGCYVVQHWAPSLLWRKWKAGGMARWDGGPEPFEGRMVRWGAWGDPAFLPLGLLRKVNGVVAASGGGWTGYTHQWRDKRRQGMAAYLMASVESKAEAEEARALGYRTFRITGRAEWNGGAGDELEHWCPAADEMGKAATCEGCLLCGGVEGKGVKGVRILPHGRGKQGKVEQLARWKGR